MAHNTCKDTTLWWPLGNYGQTDGTSFAPCHGPANLELLRIQHTEQKEANLNSSPLTAFSSDPNDLTPITPSNFLIGRAMDDNPFQGTTDNIPINSRLKLLENFKLSF